MLFFAKQAPKKVLAPLDMSHIPLLDCLDVEGIGPRQNGVSEDDQGNLSSC